MERGRARRPGERAFAVVAVIFAIVASWQAYGISGFSGLSTPGFFPMLAAGVMTVSALSVLWSTLRLPDVEEGKGRTLGGFLREVLPIRLRVMVLMVIVYMLALPWMGFVLSSSLFLFAGIQVLWRKRILITCGLTVATMAIVYGVFQVVFQVVLPQGILLRGLF
ncbi:MAG: tripartite tricarboxylate transporter TctB family protein [Rhodospirillum sp.]|nr:tripartite tricarboxylate transporter TctB family protein [Rhodospirillum sp.]MCF8490854.1 tripartite tricarboxylate transporter TctB family protein [Rhodospirillum sp.]MCF8501923.1 tripartite tricarboxylate transporter TctB family protein [Rhodospirillum sp.]